MPYGYSYDAYGRPSYGDYGMPGSPVFPPPGSGAVAPMQIPKDVIRIGEQAIWSTQRYADATALANTIARVFSVALGSQGQGFGSSLSTAETSLKEAGRIPGAYAFDVYGIAVHVYALVGSTPNTAFPVVGADMRNFQSNCTIRWDFIQSFIDVSPPTSAEPAAASTARRPTPARPRAPRAARGP